MNTIQTPRGKMQAQKHAEKTTMTPLPNLTTQTLICPQGVELYTHNTMVGHTPPPKTKNYTLRTVVFYQCLLNNLAKEEYDKYKVHKSIKNKIESFFQEETFH
jgi:hypothetical protein